MKLSAAVPLCPVCGFSSIYTDGDGPCSVRCALISASEHYREAGVPLSLALSLTREEAEFRGLPQEPHRKDIREAAHRYLLIERTKTPSLFWKLDRDLLSKGLNVEYIWTREKGRVYRFAPSLLPLLPESFFDYRVRLFSFAQLRRLSEEFPSWHFLPSVA